MKRRSLALNAAGTQRPTRLRPTRTLATLSALERKQQDLRIPCSVALSTCRGVKARLSASPLCLPRAQLCVVRSIPLRKQRNPQCTGERQCEAPRVLLATTPPLVLLLSDHPLHMQHATFPCGMMHTACFKLQPATHTLPWSIVQHAERRLGAHPQRCHATKAVVPEGWSYGAVGVSHAGRVVVGVLNRKQTRGRG